MSYQFRAEGGEACSSGTLPLVITKTRLTSTQRKKLALAALAGECVTHLAQDYGVSRKFVYQQKNIALAAIGEAFEDVKKPQDKRVLFEIKVTMEILEQLILSIVLCGRSSYRAAQRIIEDVFDHHISLGKIASITAQDAQKALTINDKQDLSIIKIACHDEYFHHNVPILVAVEPLSRYCFLLTQDVTYSEVAWINALKPLVKKGYAPDYVVADGGKPLRSGFRAIFPKTPCYYDVFHLRREFGRCILFYRKEERQCRAGLKELEERIQRFNLTPEKCPHTFEDIKVLKHFLDFDVDAIDRLRRGIGRTIHKALSLTKEYTFAEREAFYNKTIDSIEQILRNTPRVRSVATNLHCLLRRQRENLLGLFQHPGMAPIVRASSWPHTLSKGNRVLPLSCLMAKSIPIG
jgi:hypothetical protein